MNRELKFRAYGKLDHKMHTPGCLNVRLSGLKQTAVPMWWNADGDEVVWMQSTGLKDKNGKEIYEGDVLKYWAYRDYGQSGRVEGPYGPVAVTWDREHAGFVPCFGWSEYCEQLKRAEVIGNIYDNPELLSQPSQDTASEG
ncbi:MAG: YopX family protein [Candidatus Izemoplasmatales bacterium]|jgi:uncharacterized phage protein (TIGR01671 family)